MDGAAAADGGKAEPDLKMITLDDLRDLPVPGPLMCQMYLCKCTKKRHQVLMSHRTLLLFTFNFICCCLCMSICMICQKHSNLILDVGYYFS